MTVQRLSREDKKWDRRVWRLLVAGSNSGSFQLGAAKTEPPKLAVASKNRENATILVVLILGSGKSKKRESTVSLVCCQEEFILSSRELILKMKGVQ